MKLIRSLAVLLLAMASSGGAQAILLSDLLNGGSITAGDKLFDNWSLIQYVASDPSRSFNAANIDVTALTDGGLAPGPGLQFLVRNQELNVIGDDIFAFVDLAFGFRASVLAPGLQITDNSLALSVGGAFLSWRADQSNDNGSFILETAGTAAGQSDLSTTQVEFSLLDEVMTSVLSDSASFAPRSEVWITKNILVWATDATDSAGLFGFEQRFSQVSLPEPATLVLLGLGLAGLALSRRRGTA